MAQKIPTHHVITLRDRREKKKKKRHIDAPGNICDDERLTRHYSAIRTKRSYCGLASRGTAHTSVILKHAAGLGTGLSRCPSKDGHNLA